MLVWRFGLACVEVIAGSFVAVIALLELRNTAWVNQQKWLRA